MGSFIDDRGEIHDLLQNEPVSSVTHIKTLTGAVRGNHVHAKTTQWTYVVSGSMIVKTLHEERKLLPGDMWKDPPGQAHAWKAIQTCCVIVMTAGPRAGDRYEDDTQRLDTPLLK
jgi:quercetin dioxygenase-like cupin family protein